MSSGKFIEISRLTLLITIVNVDVKAKTILCCIFVTRTRQIKTEAPRCCATGQLLMQRWYIGYWKQWGLMAVLPQQSCCFESNG